MTSFFKGYNPRNKKEIAGQKYNNNCSGKKKIIFFSLLLTIALSSVANPASRPVEAFLDRIGGTGTSERILTSLAPAFDGQNYFTITSEKGKPKITGDSYLSITTGIGWYLKYYAGVCLAWNNLTVDLRNTNFPLPKKIETHRTNLKRRYYLNYCTYSYSMAFWDWERWQKEIDWMALHGINMPLALTGTEVVWYNLLVNGLGYSEEEARRFVAGPAYQAWFLMNNLEGWGGPNPNSWYKRQTVLQQNILARMRELGMEPVLAGYSGMVPHDIKEKKGWDITFSGKWCNFVRPEFLKPTDPHFDEIAELYYREMRTLFGSSSYYSIDLFHEGSVPKGVNVAETYAKVYDVMKRFSGAKNPQWIIQSWGNNPRQEALDALNTGTLIVLDLFSDGNKRWGSSYKQSSANQHEFVYCMLHNFGGRTGLHGRLNQTIHDFYDAKKQFPETMLGIGTTMEGIETNPMLYEAFYELPWHTNPISAAEWIKNYPQIRYGKVNEKASLAWTLLNQSVYNCPTPQQGTSESILCARPSMTVKSVSTWSTSTIYWNPNDVRSAAALLLSQSGQLRGVNYDYDVVDVVRQTLSDYGAELLTHIKETHNAQNTRLRNAYIDTFLNLILDQDRLLNTHPDFRVGKWIASARKTGNTLEEKDLYEKNARMLITTWGDREQANQGGLHDYSNREWGGLMRDYYYPRWAAYFEKIKSNQTPPSANNFFSMEWAWVTSSSSVSAYPETPHENPIDVARELFAKYFTLP
jgi:alpha-N-acetylglucosaminidase